VSQFAGIRRFVLVAWAERVARAFLPAVSAFVPTLCQHSPTFTDHPPTASDRPTPAGMRARQPERPRHEYSN
jgi:hypothetical protein